MTPTFRKGHAAIVASAGFLPTRYNSSFMAIRITVVPDEDPAKAPARTLQIDPVHMGYKPDLSNAGGPNSPNWHKELAMSLMHSRPELKGKILTEGTWDFAIVDELAPHPGDLVVVKTRYSGFAGTTLDSMLRMRGVQFLFFAGIASNVCVESTLRDAFFLDYWPILLSDGAMPAGSARQHEATLFNVESFFGWTVQSAELLKSLKLQAA